MSGIGRFKAKFHFGVGMEGGGSGTEVPQVGGVAWMFLWPGSGSPLELLEISLSGGTETKRENRLLTLQLDIWQTKKAYFL